MRQISEAETRKELIDPQLEKAGWDLHDDSQVGIEIPVDGFDPDAWKQLEKELYQIREKAQIKDVNTPAGISDYVLYRENGEILAVVEAKKTSIDPRLAAAQTEFYVTQIEKLPGQSFRPFGFMTNGHEIQFYDVGYQNKREVQGFFSRLDLETKLHIRQNKIPLSEVEIKREITDRTYQMEAIRRVAEAFDGGKRRALLTMATGTGKTRVAMSLVDIFMRANQAQRILFVADRDALVKQGLEEGFKDYIPDEPATRLRSHHIDKDNRLYVVTLLHPQMVYSKFLMAKLNKLITGLIGFAKIFVGMLVWKTLNFQ